MAHIVLLVIVAASILLMLIRPRGIAELYWAGGGALLLIVFRLIPLNRAAKAVAEGADVYLFLTGMMLLSELARENGVFDWVAARAVQGAKGSCSRLFLLVYLAGVLITVCMSNDATAVVLTPAVLAAVQRSGAKPLPCLFACAMIANAASFVLPISNPANLVVFRSGMPPLPHWLATFLVPSLVSIAVTYAVLRWYFRKDLRGAIHAAEEPAPLRREGRVVLCGLACIVAVLLTASAFNIDLGLPTFLAATAITLLLCLQSRTWPWKLLKEISWSTLALVAALFILVAAVESIGGLRLAEQAIAAIQRVQPAFAAALAAFAVGIANNLANNLPVGLIAGAALTASHTHGLLASAILIGVDLGPNLSVTGSLATILWLIALRKEKIDVSAGAFLRVGLIAMPAALLASIGTLIALNYLLST